MKSIYCSQWAVATIIISFSRFLQVSQSTNPSYPSSGISTTYDPLHLRTIDDKTIIICSRQCRDIDSKYDCSGGSICKKYITDFSGGARKVDEESEDENSDDDPTDIDEDVDEDELDDNLDDDSSLAENEDDDDNDGSNPDEEDVEEDEESDEEDFSNISRQRKRSVKRRPTMFETGMGSLSTAAAAAFKITKGGVKAAVDLVSAKHVSSSQIAGKWRMEQEVQISKGASVTCPASLEFTEDGQVLTSFEGKVSTTGYKFTERPWPRKCTIQFEAAAFQAPGDKEPVVMYYKGHFKKSMMNPNVVLIRGRVYKFEGSMFWKKQKKCGTFKATQKRYR